MAHHFTWCVVPIPSLMCPAYFREVPKGHVREAKPIALGVFVSKRSHQFPTHPRDGGEARCKSAAE